MKIFKGLFFTVAAFFIFSCTQLNLKNPVGAVNVSLPSSSRMIIEEGQTVNSFEKINYLISLYSSSGALVDKKMAPEGSSVTFPDVAEGSYVVKAFCNATSNGKEECIAAGFKSAEVKGGEVTPVIIELSYNRPDKIDVNRSSIRYTGKTEFSSENEMAAYVSDNFKDFLSAEIVFTNGWSETVVDADRFFVEKNQVSQIPGGTFTTGGTGGATEVIVSGGKDPCQFKVTLSLNENITKELIVTLYVVKELLNNDPIVIPDLTVGLSEDNPCTTPEQLEQAIANVNDNGRIYLAGTNGVLELNGTFSLGKNCTLYSTVNGLQVKRKDNGTYFYVSSEVMIDATSKGITFTDDSDITEVSEGNGFFYGPGTLKAYSVAFENIKSNAVNVGNAVLSGCSFINISSNYGAVYVEAGKSARIGSCNFSGNTSKKSENYADVYFVKDASSSLTLDENVTTDIGIYVDNVENVDPEIVFDATNYGGNLNIAIKNGPETGIDSMIILSCTGIPNQEKIRVVVDGSTDEYMNFTSGNDYCLTKTSY